MGGAPPAAPAQGHHHSIPGAATAALGAVLKHNPSAERHVAPEETQQPVATTVRYGATGVGNGPSNINAAEAGLVICGPLFNYRRMSAERSDRPMWHGSVLVVTKPGTRQPELTLSCLGRLEVGVGADTNGSANPESETALPSAHGLPRSRTFRGENLYEDPKSSFWRFSIDLPIQDFEAKWEYIISGLRFGDATESKKPFAVPSKAQSMRIIFHSCNGFSVGTDVDAWSGPALWNDVLRMHSSQPFHVMIGGGDQIYNDSVRVDGPLREWTDIGNPKKRRDFPFNEDMRHRCDEYYFNNYISWYGQEPFKTANGIIPQLNLWDDHDIIDGFGSYTHHFMRCAVFRGIGGVAHKYYLLFQHHLAPPASTFTTDAPQTTIITGDTTAYDSVQLQDTWVMKESRIDPSYIVGSKPGPYVEECSHSMYCQLGARVALLGIDARTERTRHQVNYPETYDLAFNRLHRELTANDSIKHVILLLGIPIAYPRLQWLENIFNSPIIGPLRLLNKRFGFGGSFFNQFDGGVDLLDDLDDHYTSRHHKKERREFVQRLQAISKKHSVRITILGGDVHLAAIGRFFSNAKENIPPERDWRYMANVISSAITNKPPPQAVANLLARRNKIHHLDHTTDETLLEIFDRDPGIRVAADKKKNGTGPGSKTAEGNHATMPSRNYAIIAESRDHAAAVYKVDEGPQLPGKHSFYGELPQPGAPTTNGAGPAAGSDAITNGSAAVNGVAPVNGTTSSTSSDSRSQNPRRHIHEGEKNAGTLHAAASGLTKTGLGGEFGLDVTLRVEISNKDPEGHTDGYGFTVPGLDCRAYADQDSKW